MFSYSNNMCDLNLILRLTSEVKVLFVLLWLKGHYIQFSHGMCSLPVLLLDLECLSFSVSMTLACKKWREVGFSAGMGGAEDEEETTGSSEKAESVWSMLAYLLVRSGDSSFLTTIELDVSCVERERFGMGGGAEPFGRVFSLVLGGTEPDDSIPESWLVAIDMRGSSDALSCRDGLRGLAATGGPDDPARTFRSIEAAVPSPISALAGSLLTGDISELGGSGTSASAVATLFRVLEPSMF